MKDINFFISIVILAFIVSITTILIIYKIVNFYTSIFVVIIGQILIMIICNIFIYQRKKEIRNYKLFTEN